MPGMEVRFTCSSFNLEIRKCSDHKNVATCSNFNFDVQKWPEKQMRPNCSVFLLCIHKWIQCIHSLVRAVGQATQGPGIQKGSWAGPRPWTAASLGPWPLGSLAQSMHKSVVHAQEISCVYTRDSFVYTQEISILKKYRFSVVLEAVHVQQPEPIVENVSCVCTFSILYPNGFRLKMDPYSTVVGFFIIPPAQTCGAHIFRFLFILSNIDCIIEILCLFQAHICTTETLHFPEFTDLLKKWQMLGQLFTIRDKSWSYGPCDQFRAITSCTMT